MWSGSRVIEFLVDLKIKGSIAVTGTRRWKMVKKIPFVCFRFKMAFKLALLVSSLAVATQASNTLWACRK
jgi:hypothetical protein